MKNNRGYVDGIRNGKIEVECFYCGTKFMRIPCLSRHEHVFCCRDHYFAALREKKISAIQTRKKAKPNIKNKSYVGSRFYKYTHRDKLKGVETSELSVEEFLNLIETSVCAYCGTKENLGFDRIDNSLGHTSDNVLVGCVICNRTRGDRFTVEQMKEIGKLIASFRANNTLIKYEDKPVARTDFQISSTNAILRRPIGDFIQCGLPGVDAADDWV